jgi:hypothetical protein
VTALSAGIYFAKLGHLTVTMKTPPARPSACLHPQVVSTDGRKHHCTSCGREVIVSETTRSGWAEMGRRLQGYHRKRPSAPSGQEAMKL